MRQPHCLVVIPTLNRNEMVNEALNSVCRQTYGDWSALISDNGSRVPVATTLRPEHRADARVTLVRREHTVSGNEHGEALLRQAAEMPCDFVIVLADDDALLPHALETVAIHAPNYKAIASSYYGYEPHAGRLSLEVFPGAPGAGAAEFDPQQFLRYMAHSTGVRLKGVRPAQRRRPNIGPTHVSAHFFERAAIAAAYERYGALVKGVAYGDVGLFRLGFHCKPSLYIADPLVVVRRHASYGVSGSIGGQGPRQALAEHHDFSLRRSPLRGVTFSNGMLGSYLAVVDELGVARDQRVAAVVYLRQLREVLRDRPRTRATLRDALEVVPPLLARPHETVLASLKFGAAHLLHRDLFSVRTVATGLSDMAEAVEAGYGRRRLTA